METTEDSKRRNAISEEVYERYANTDKYAVIESVSSAEVASFTAEDKLADPSKRHDTNALRSASASIFEAAIVIAAIS